MSFELDVSSFLFRVTKCLPAISLSSSTALDKSSISRQPGMMNLDGFRVWSPGVPLLLIDLRFRLIPGNFELTTACGSVDSDSRSSCFSKVPVMTMFGADSPVKHHLELAKS